MGQSANENKLYSTSAPAPPLIKKDIEVVAVEGAEENKGVGMVESEGLGLNILDVVAVLVGIVNAV